jgi:hypothetical protein
MVRVSSICMLLEPEEFEDLVHANRVGKRRLSLRIADILGEEWHARITRDQPEKPR